MHLIENLITKRDRLIEGMKRIPYVTKVECDNIDYDKSVITLSVTQAGSNMADNLFLLKNVMPLSKRNRALATFMTEKTSKITFLFKEQ